MTAPPELDRRRPRAAGALRVAGIVTLEAASVIVLHQLGRYSWMRVDWSDLAGWIETSPPEDVLLGVTRTVALVLAWWLLLSSLLYVGAAATGTPKAVRSLRWALLPGLRRVLDAALAVSLAGGVTTVSTSTIPAAAAAAELGGTPARAVRPPESIALKLAIYHATAPLDRLDKAAVAYEVQPGDSLWEIAERQLGDPARWADIWELNRARLEHAGATSPHVLHVGWILELPSAVDRESDAATPYTVQPGDTLWSIADRELGDPARLDDIVDFNRGRPQPDGGTLTDPDLIRVGWELHLPVNAGEETTPSPEPQPTPRAEPAGADPEPHGSEPADPAVSAPTAFPGQHERSDAGSNAERPASPSPPDDATEREHAADPPPDTVGDGDIPSDGTDLLRLAPIVAGLTGATVLATGVMLHLRRLRRRTSATARVRSTWRRRPTDVERAVVAASDVPLVRWAGQELAALAERLRPRDLAGAAPVAVELSPESGIEILWDRPVPDVPPSSSWSAADGGWAWRLPYDPDAPVPADDRPAPLPALVTIGEREGRQLLLDLEAYGAVSVTGNPSEVDDFGRAVGLELCTDEDLADAYVSTIGVDIPGADRLHRLTALSATDAHALLDASATSVGDAVERARVSSSFELRVGHNAPQLETVVVVVDPDETRIDPGDLVAISPPRRGVAAVLLGDADAPATITIAPDGTARLEPLGITFDAVGLPTTTHDHLDELLDEAARTEDTPDLPIDDPGEATLDADGAVDARGNPGEATTDVDPSGKAHRLPLAMPTDHDDDDDAPADAGPAIAVVDMEAGSEVSATDDDQGLQDGRLVVRVLGPPRVEGRPHLRRRELALTVYLACRGRPVKESSIRNAMWNGQAVQGKTLWNLVTRTRRALGLHDGEPVLPPANRVQSTLALSERVTTDLAVFRTLYDRAITSPSGEAIALLRDALSLVEGEPFDAADFDWAHHDHQFVAEASGLIEQAVEHLVDLAMQAGDIDTARAALVQGLRGLPGNEVLYRARMRLEHDTGNLPGVKTAWDDLVTYLDGLYSEPSEATELLYRELVGARKR